MGKAQVLKDSSGVSVELDSWFTWWQVGVNHEGQLTTAARVDRDQEDGEHVEVSITPKQLRKIAKALKALADKVDPPAPKVEYFRVDGDMFYRIAGVSEPELWDIAGTWVPTTTNCRNVEELREWWSEFSFEEISKDDLPAAAKAA